MHCIRQLAKGSLIILGAIAKGSKIPFRINFMRNPPIACNAYYVSISNMSLGELNLK
jgi:hypothetical protein